MNAPGEPNQMDKLWGLVQDDPRTEGEAVDLRPGLYIIEIGDQDPFWQHPIDRERLMSDDLRATEGPLAPGPHRCFHRSWRAREIPQRPAD